MPAPGASGWSGRRVGLAPTGKAPPCHGARGEHDIRTGFLRERTDGSSSPTAGPSEMRFATFENGTDVLSTRRGPRGSGAGARASHPSRAAVLPPPYEPSG